MGTVIIRFIFVYILLHIVLFFVEWYRYKHSHWSWYGFKHNGMLEITYFVLSLDTIGSSVGVLALIGYWIFSPVID